MEKLIVVIAIIAAVAFAWHKGWIGEWIGAAFDSGSQSVRKTQRDATKVRTDQPPEEKK
jgi:hypothetical protein